MDTNNKNVLTTTTGSASMGLLAEMFMSKRQTMRYKIILVFNKLNICYIEAKKDSRGIYSESISTFSGCRDDKPLLAA